jgi:methionyl-tRNA synthetase
VSPPGVDRSGPRPASSRPGADLDISNDDFIRTTEPRHHRAVQHFLQKIYDNGFIELGVYAGWYCVGARTTRRVRAARRQSAPSTSRPVELLEEENYFFKLSAFEDRSSSGTRPTPTPCARVEAQRGARLHQGRLEDISITRTSTRGG